MKITRPFNVILSLVVLAGVMAALAVHFWVGGMDGSLPLVYLYSIGQLAGQMERWLETYRASSAGVGVDLALYGALTLIGLLIILRAVASAVVVYRQRKYLGLPILGRPRPDLLRNGLAARRGIMFGRGVTGKMLLAFAGIVALFGLCSAAVVYFTLVNSLREHQLKRAAVLALNVSDSAAGHLATRHSADLPGLLRKLAADKTMAYIVVTDRGGAIVARSPGELPGKLPPANDHGATQSWQRRTLTVGSAPVYETAAPVLDGQAGLVRVGLWANQVEAEIRRATAPVVSRVFAAVAAGLLISIYVVWRINRPILRLVRIASQINRGALDTPLGATRDAGEFGALSRSLERLRCSVKAAMARLR